MDTIEPVTVGDRVAWHADPARTGTVLRVGPSSPAAVLAVTVAWTSGIDGCTPELAVESRDTLVVIEKVDKKS